MFDTRIIEIASRRKGRRTDMAGNPRYYPDELVPFFGYDTLADWLFFIEWVWLETLAHFGVMPKNTSKLLTFEAFTSAVNAITTTKMDHREKKLGHDILALIALARNHLRPEVMRFFHYTLTSYDTINSMYNFLFCAAFSRVILPMMQEVDQLWRGRIKEYAETPQVGRTHLQHALPITAGFWLATIHSRYENNCRNMFMRSKELAGKFSGATGTYNAQRVLLGDRLSIEAGQRACEMLDLKWDSMTTQILVPEPLVRFLFEACLLSGSMDQLGEDVRILQMPEISEVASRSSSSSTMAHKRANPITAENLCGMHWIEQGEFLKAQAVLVSDLQRDLRNSCVMRDFPAILVYLCTQLKNVKRLLGSLDINRVACERNLGMNAKQLTAELMHLALQRQGFLKSHQVVNKVMVPYSRDHNVYLTEAVQDFQKQRGNMAFKNAWRRVPRSIKEQIRNPEQYLGWAKELALKEAENVL